jgi:regulator of protease activity HflC (stomatin/prohibitin superfamily)
MQQQEINLADGRRQAEILRAEGEAKAIALVAEATADAIRAIATAAVVDGGIEALQMQLAKSYIDQWGNLAKASTTMIVPAELGNIGAMVGTALQIVQRSSGGPPAAPPTPPPAMPPTMPRGTPPRPIASVPTTG